MSVRNRPQRLIWIFVVIGLTSCTPIAEQSLKKQLSSTIGPAAQYDVDIDGLKLSAGKAQRVAIVGQRVQPEGLPVLDQLTIDLRDIKYDRKAKRLERLVGIDATARITATDLAIFLQQQRNLPNATVLLQPPDRATVGVRQDLSLFGVQLPVGVPADATGKLTKNNDRIYFMISELRAAGINLGDRPAKLLAQTINPVVDLSGLPVDVNVTSLRVENNMVQLELTGDPARLLQSQLPSAQVAD